MSPLMSPLMVFDVESVGLHGEGFSVGYVVLVDGKEVEFGCFTAPLSSAAGDDEGRSWVEANIPPTPITHESPRPVRDAFWFRWAYWKERGAILAADCGWPVEARFLCACVDDDKSRSWSGPYPFMEISSVLVAKGMDPLAKYDRLPSELPAHNPLFDARQSARLLWEAL